METMNNSSTVLTEVTQLHERKATDFAPRKSDQAFEALERAVYAALETYSNVHRGSGHFSMVTTHLYEQARDIVLAYLGLDKSKYAVIFCSPRRATLLEAQLEPGKYHCLDSTDFGLPLGVRALAIDRKTLPHGVPFHTGGGTTKLVSKDWIIWASAPDKFEAGTPAIINVIAFAAALRIIAQTDKDVFKGATAQKLSATEILYMDELVNFSGRELLHELTKTLIGKDILVPTTEGRKPMINLDNSASTPTFTTVWDVFRQMLRQPKQLQDEVTQQVKLICSNTMGVPLDAYDVLFTSNTTEAINLAAESLSREAADGFEPVVLSSLLEHSSNDLPWRMVKGSSVIRLAVDTEGFFDLNELESVLSAYNLKNEFGPKRIKLVAVSGASNVLGTCNNLAEISKLVHQYGARLLVDAAQLVAHRKVDMEQSGIDYLAFSAHKLYAPFGCGVLMARKGLLSFNPNELATIQLLGEENAAGIAALGKALVLLQRVGMDVIRDEEQILTAHALRGMQQIPGLRVYGINDSQLPQFAHKLGVIVFDIKNMAPNRIAKELALQNGIGVRYGCHCAHIIIKRLLNISPFLERFQAVIQTMFPKLRLPGLVRVSIGIENSREDVHRLIYALGTIGRSNAPEPNTGRHVSKALVQRQMDEFVAARALKVYSTQ